MNDILPDSKVTQNNAQLPAQQGTQAAPIVPQAAPVAPYPPQSAPVDQCPPQYLPDAQYPLQGAPMTQHPPQGVPAPQPVQQAPLLPPNLAYKKLLRRSIMLIVLALVLYQVITVIVSIMSGVILGISAALSGEPIMDTASAQAAVGGEFMAWTMLVAFLLAVLALLLVSGKKLFTTNLTTINQRMSLKALLVMFGLFFGIVGLTQFVAFGLMTLIDALQLPVTLMPDVFADLVNFPGILSVVLVGPVVEEIVFRGAVLRRLQPYGQNYAIVVSSLLFAVMHLILFQASYAFFMGLILAYCALRYSIKWAMLLHIVNNGVFMLLIALGIGMELSYILFGVFLAAGVLAFVFSLKGIREQRQTGKPTPIIQVLGIQPHPGQPEAVAVEAKPFVLTFSSVWLIVALAIAAIIMVAMLFISL